MENQPSIAGVQEIARLFNAPSFVAGDILNSVPVARDAYQSYCNIWAGEGPPEALALADVAGFCTPYLDEQGRTFGQKGPAPFEGGQCDGSPYLLTGNFVSSSPPEAPSTSTPISATLVGPVYLETVDDPNGTFVFIRGQEDDPKRVYRVENETQSAQLEDISLVRADGGPDDCGDPDGDFEPGDGYQGETYGDPQSSTNGDGSSNSISVGAPVVNNDGSISLPITINGDDFDVGVPGLSEPEGDPGGDFGPSEAGESIPNPGDGEPELLPPAPPGATCIAIAVALTGVPDSEGEVSNTDPNTRFTAPQGNVSVLLSSDDGTRVWSSDVVIYSRRSLVAIPVEGLTIVGHRVKLVTGRTSVVRPIYRIDEEIEES